MGVAIGGLLLRVDREQLGLDGFVFVTHTPAIITHAGGFGRRKMREKRAGIAPGPRFVLLIILNSDN